MKSSPSVPQAPDPYATADAQTQQNIQTAIANARMNRTNQTTPWGSISWQQGDVDANGVPTYSSNVTLNPQDQAILDMQRQTGLTRQQLIQQLLANSGGSLAQPLRMDNLHPIYDRYAQQGAPQGGGQGGQTPQIAGIPGAAAGGMGLQQQSQGMPQGMPQAPAPQRSPNVNKPGTLMPSVGSATQGDPMSGMGADVGAQGAAPQGRISVDPQTGMLMLDGQVLDRNDPRLYGSRGPQNAAVAEQPRGEGVVDPAIAASQYWDDMQTRHAGRRQLDSAGVSSGQEGQGFGEFNQNYLDSLIYDDEYGFLAQPEHVDSSRDPDDRTRMQRQFAAMMAGMGGANALGLGQGAGVNAATGAGLGGSAGEAAAAGGMGSPAAAGAGAGSMPGFAGELGAIPAGQGTATSMPGFAGELGAPSLGGQSWLEAASRFLPQGQFGRGQLAAALFSLGSGGGGADQQAPPGARPASGRAPLVRRPSASKSQALAQILRRQP